MSVTPAEVTAAESFFEKNVANLFHELIDVADFRHEWEALRAHTAAANLHADPVTLLQKLEPTAPTVGQEDVRLIAMQTEISRLTQLVENLVGATPTANPAPVVTPPAAAAPVQVSTSITPEVTPTPVATPTETGVPATPVIPVTTPGQ